MIAFGVGVITSATYDVKRIDFDYFDGTGGRLGAESPVGEAGRC
jgi:hypothetical protein